jgi:hypothetical protein
MSDEGVHGSTWGLREHERGSFSSASPPFSGTTGVTREPRSCMPDLTSTCTPYRMMSALEQQERAAHRGDNNIVLFIFLS